MNGISFWRLQAMGWTAFCVTMATSRIGRYPLFYMLGSKGAMAAIGLVHTGFILRPIYRRFLKSDATPARTIADVPSGRAVRNPWFPVGWKPLR